MVHPEDKTGIARIDVECGAVTSGQRDPFDAARAMWNEAMSAMTRDGDETLHGHWLLWGNLTDDPDQSARDEELIRRACAEWTHIAAAGHQTQDTTRYFDRWLYGELGLPRPDRS